MIRAPLRRARRVNYYVGGALTGVGGFLGGLAGIGITGAIVGTGGIAAVPMAATDVVVHNDLAEISEARHEYDVHQADGRVARVADTRELALTIGDYLEHL